MITSTVDGMVLDVPVEVGNQVIQANTFNEGTTISSVADMTDLIFRGQIDESEIENLRVGIPLISVHRGHARQEIRRRRWSTSRPRACRTTARYSSRFARP